MTSAKQQQFIAAMQFIDKHIDQPLTLQLLADEVGISLASLKRLFVDITEQSPGQCIRRLRLELGFKHIAQSKMSILQAALEVGFDNHAAFSRAFKQCFGYSPKQARQTHNIVKELAAVALDEPDFTEVDDIHLQVTTAVGSYFEAAPKAWETLAKTLQNDELSDSGTCLFFGIGHDNPHHEDVAIDHMRFSAGVSMATPYDKLQKFTLPKGFYARFNFSGKPMNLGLAYHYIFGTWNERHEQCIDHDKLAFTVFDHLPASGIADEVLQIWVPMNI